MRQITCFVAALTAILTLAGCVDYSETVTLDEKGGGEIGIRYSVTSDFHKDFGENDAETLKAETEKLKAQFEGEGITISRLFIEDGEEARYYNADFAFSDHEALNTSDFFDEFSTFKIKSGNTYKYSRTLLVQEENKKEPDDETKEKLAYIFKDNVFSFSVRMPAPVTATNGTIGDDGYTVTWKYGFGEILMLEEPAEMTAECRMNK